MPDLVVAGAGMAGLAAAAEARALGATVTILERGDRSGGSMLLSSGVVWRYRDFDVFRAECPDGDPALQLAMFENLDADLRWLESLGARGERSAGLEQIYGRNMPAPPARVGEHDFVPLAQLSAHHATVTNERGERYEVRTWSEIDVVQWTALQPRARAWFRLEDSALEERVRDRTVGEMVDAAAEAGAAVERSSGSVTIETVAGITSTLGGLQIDAHGRVVDDVFAAGGDAGGIATGGYASGLAAALVMGRIAARSALGVG